MTANINLGIYERCSLLLGKLIAEKNLIQIGRVELIMTMYTDDDINKEIANKWITHIEKYNQ